MSGKRSARDRLLRAAAELFYADGVAATGIDAITARAGVARMSLYNNFSSKADLVQDYLQNRLQEWQQLLAERLVPATTPDERILAVFDSYVDHAGLAYEWGFRGCGLLNAAAELPVSDPGRMVVVGQKDEVERLFRHHLAEIDADAGRLIDETAEHLTFLLEGAMARAGLEGHDARLHTARRIAVSILARFRDGQPLRPAS